MSQDRGYASGPWLGALRGFDCHFILRWKLNYHLVTEAGVKQATWKIPRGKVGLAPRAIWDAVHHCNVQGSVLFFPIPHPDFPEWPLTLVVGRRKGAKPWYLVTNEQVENAEDAWKVVLAYARRWRVEVLFRNLKSELAIQSLRVSLGRPSQVAGFGDAGLCLSHGDDGPSKEEGTRLADRVHLPPHRNPPKRSRTAL